MKCAWKCLVVLISMLASWFAMSVAGTSCRNSSQCAGKYRSCCAYQCDYRRYCNNSCDRDEDCGPTDPLCISNICRSRKQYLHIDCHECPPGYDCQADENCYRGHYCLGTCFVRENDSKLSTFGLICVLIIAGCVVLGIYCTYRRISRQLQQRQQVPARQVATMHDVPAVSDAVTGGEPSDPPIHPGGLPPYQLSPERLERVEEPPPPTYEQAVRESQDYSFTSFWTLT